MTELLRGMRRLHRSTPLALTVALALLSGCSTMRTGMGRARTVSKGHFQSGVGLGATGKASQPDSRLLGFYGAGSIRYGVTDQVELGGRLDASAGLLVESKIQLLRSPSEESGLDIALAPHVSVASVQTSSGSFLCGLSGGSCAVDFGVSSAAIPLMVGFNVGGRNQVILAPHVAYERASYEGALSQSLVAGASLSFAQVAGEDQWLIYDLSAEYPVATTFSSSFFQNQYLQGAFRLQAQMSLLFGQ